MANKDVSVTLRARVEGYVAAMNQAKAATTGFSKEAQSSLRQIGTSMTHIGRGMTLGLTVPLVGAGVAAGKMASDFQQSFTRMVGLAEVPAKEVGRLQEAVKGLSGETGRAPQELAAGLYTAASSGMDASQALEATTLAARAAALGMGQAKDSTGLIAAATAAYGRENISATRTMDVLTAAIREGRAEPDEMAHALGRVIPIAAQMGIEFDEIAGATAYLSNIMGDTDITVTGLRDALVKLNNPTVQGREALRMMGTSFEELQGALESGGLLGALDLLREHGFNENSEALQRLFADVQGFNAASALLADNSGQLATTLGKTANAAGSFSEAWEGWLGTDAAKVQQGIGKLKVGLLEVGEVLLPIAADVIGFAGSVASAFSELPEPVQGVVVALGGLVAAAGPMIWMAGSIARSIVGIAEAIAMVNAAAAGSGWMRIIGMAGASVGVAGAAATGAFLGYSAMPEEGGPKLFGQRMNRQNVRRGVDVITGAIRAEFSPDVRPRLADDMKPRTPEGRFIGPVQGPPTAGAQMGPPSLPELNRILADELREERDAYLEAGEAAVIYNGKVLSGAAAEAQLANFRAVLASEQDHYNREINAGMEIAEQQLATYNRQQEAVQSYADTVASTDWGEASFTAAGTAASKFNAMVFGGVVPVAAQQQAMDGLAGALEKVGTIGVGGLHDFNLATEEGRAGLSALTQVAGAFEPQLSAAVAAAGGSVTTLQGSIQGLRDGFIQMAVDAGIPKDEAVALADAIGLIPTHAETLIELSGDEEARIRLGLIQGALEGLSEEAQREIALQASTGDFSGALATAQFEFRRMKAEAEGIVYIRGDSSSAQRSAIDAKDRIEEVRSKTVTITAIDRASAVARAVQRAIDGVQSKTVTITTRRNDITTVYRVDARGAMTRQGADRNVDIATAAGGYFGSTSFRMIGEAGAEVVLPLTNAARMMQLISDPRVAGPLFAALGQMTPYPSGGVSGGGMAAQQSGATPMNVQVFIGDEEITSRVRVVVRDENRERDRRAMAGAR